ncbi:FecR family protein [Zobellia amurskyensis]|uniref:FecR family protein n=1 Tax=Zobellia amurskyensis TaxID=248905 RepID=A0A7X2ZSD3_9FLAO|nr:FecR family protein [Zobellia amurskyensis]MUH35527.1 FecR family protein [Zobellia amurskyensis]
MSVQIKGIIAKYLTKQASIAELDKLTMWIENPLNKEEFLKYIKVDHAINLDLMEFGTNKSRKSLLEFIEKEKNTLKRRRMLKIGKYAAAIIIFIVGYLYENKALISAPELINSEIVVSEDKLEVGTDKAVLTLEDGSTIDLEKGKSIKTKYTRSNGEQLVYDSHDKSEKQVVFNYLTIPRGRQFHVKLADGTLVWLNSESKLKFPVSFEKGKCRTVELIYGEAYFEVSPSSKHDGATFKVLNTSQEVEVLGTIFNIKAYRDETNIYTTLVEGKVTIHTPTSKEILKPNEQSVLNLKNKGIRIQNVNVDQEISWRKGLFDFKGKSLDEITKVLSRWYDVDFDFSNDQQRYVKFNGVLRKEESIEEILNSILITSTIEAYEIKDKNITIK